MPRINRNGVDPDQTPRSAASDQGLHCLSLSLLWDTRHKWINPKIVLDELAYNASCSSDNRNTLYATCNLQYMYIAKV